jgi:hypothetical protein
MHSKEQRAKRLQALLSSDDVALFTNGGCHVFALTLHDRFKYPIHYIPGHTKGISHIYCRVGPPWFGVDVSGFTPEDKLTWHFSGDWRSPHLSRSELLSIFQPLSEDEQPGTMCGDEWFVPPARERAERRIDKFLGVYSGKDKRAI